VLKIVSRALLLALYRRSTVSGAVGEIEKYPPFSAVRAPFWRAGLNRFHSQSIHDAPLDLMKSAPGGFRPTFGFEAQPDHREARDVVGSEKSAFKHLISGRDKMSPPTLHVQPPAADSLTRRQ
jgi:hypothetical protein